MRKNEVNRVYASRLAKRGYIVVCINYSLCPDVTYPTQVSDVMASYRWVAENGEAYGFDLDRVFVAGDSAGGQLALLHRGGKYERRIKIALRRFGHRTQHKSDRVDFRNV